MILKRIFQALKDKTFSAHKRKQNLKLTNAVKAAEAHTNRANKTASLIAHYQEELKKNKGDITKLSKRGQDFVKNHPNDFAKGVTAANAPTVQKQAQAATQAAGRAGNVVGKMANQRKSLAQGQELGVQANGYKGGIKVKMQKQTSLADKMKNAAKGKPGSKPQTVAKIAGEKTAQQGNAKTKVTTAISESQAKHVDKTAQDVVTVADGKKTAAQKSQMQTRVKPTAQATTVETVSKNQANKVVSGGAGQKATVVGKKVIKGGLGKWGKPLAIGAGVAAAGGLAVGGAKVYQNKKKAKNFSEKGVAQTVAEDASLAGAATAAGGLGYAGYQGAKAVKNLAKEVKGPGRVKAIASQIKAVAGGKAQGVMNKNQAKAAQAIQKMNKGGNIAAKAAGASIVAGAAAKGIKAIRNKKKD